MSHNNSVFINVPFDKRYLILFRALIYTVIECDLIPRCTQEADDGATVRLDKIYKLIHECRLSIHDLSRTQLDTMNRLPRFNMPLELGIFLGAKRYGQNSHRKKACLILDSERYRHQKYCSDISGQDIRPHENNVAEAIRAVRNWAQTTSVAANLPGATKIETNYVAFQKGLPKICAAKGLRPSELTFLDYRQLATTWVESY